MGTTNRVRLREDGFYLLQIPLPPLLEQKRIVAKVQLLTSKIDEARGLRRDIRIDRDTALRSLFRRIIDSAPRRPMSEVAPLERRPVDIKEDQSYPELGVRSFGRGTFHKPALAGAEVGTKKLYRLCPGDVVFSNVFAWEGAIAVVKPEDESRVGSHRFIARRTNPDLVTAAFLCFYFLTREGIEKLGEASPGGAGRNRTLGLKKLDAIEVPFPPLYAQRRFNQLQEQVAETEAAEDASGKKLDALMPALLERAFGGEL